MKSKQLNEKQPVFVDLQSTTQTMELTNTELKNVDGGCNKCDRNNDGKITWVEKFICHFRPVPVPHPFPFPRPIRGAY
jgi:hypothetical protein